MNMTVSALLKFMIHSLFTSAPCLKCDAVPFKSLPD